MQVQVHHQTKDRKVAIAFTAPQRRILRAIPHIAEVPKLSEITPAKCAQAPDTFSPLIQEFLDECGYSDK
jgi:hypothetical protein